ncbi:LysR family transcriptional regulator [Sinirhodobacter populi]|uniref:LysR family transcriptional regulator n=1 Tax=Paenirhodobacter populi TaxID=2306993 RepID=A0A443KE47_9RHOB|nr:LysR family transcriptional regulator [Sinirhodobacter populi]RWR31139.1 LysR family transcriptional regulator [Sinirhodobacter populi]
MIQDLPSPLLRSFVAVVDCGSLSSASVRIGRSESALSLQMSRLEDVIGRPVFDRDGRALKLNGTGAQLLTHARAILGRIDAARAELGQAVGPPARIGIVQDFVESILRPTLAELRDGVAGRPISVVIGSTAELLQAMSEERIDTALYAGEAVGATVTHRLPVQWFGDPALAAAEVVPLVGITPPCPFLKAAQQALDEAGRPWRMALVTPSLDGLRATVQAGLGVTCRTKAGLALVPLPAGHLPDLPDISYAVTERRCANPEIREIARNLSRQLAILTSGQ